MMTRQYHDKVNWSDVTIVLRIDRLNRQEQPVSQQCDSQMVRKSYAFTFKWSYHHNQLSAIACRTRGRLVDSFPVFFQASAYMCWCSEDFYVELFVIP